MNEDTNTEEGLSYISSGVPVCSILHLFITTILSEIVIASSWSCVTKTMVIPVSFCIFFSSSLISCLILASRAEKGSSRRSIYGLSTRALAMATLCCCPPDNCEGYLFSVPSIFTSFRCDFTASSITKDLILRSLSPKARFSLTVI